MKPVVVYPDPARVVEGLRDTGYELNTAIEDIIDNSIAANATLVDVFLDIDINGEVVISVADNGCGMDEHGLINAMRYGSPSRPDPASLGKFGLGLKTASTAFCRRLSVITRPAAHAATLKATWDLDHIVSLSQWELLFDAPTSDELAVLDDTAPSSSGTLVVWEKVDRLLRSYSNPGGAPARKALQRITEALMFHIGMVYQRFLDPNDHRARSVSIRVNGHTVAPWDPFCVDDKATEIVATEAMKAELPSGKSAAFDVKAYVIPRREEFASRDRAKEARISNELQGLYIYRENRLIHFGDWLGLFAAEPHLSLLRVEFSFDHRLDDAFRVDIKKSKIILQDKLYEWLEGFLTPPRRAADERYRRGQKKKIQDAVKGAHDSSNSSIANKEDEVRMANVEVTDEKKGEVEIENRHGKFRIKLSVSAPSKSGEFTVQPVEGIDDGYLWEPCIIDTHHAVRINMGHQFYHKVYVPNLGSGTTVTGLDSLLWALCEAELGTINEKTRSYFTEMRYEVSRILRKLTEDLPEPDTSDEDVTTD